MFSKPNATAQSRQVILKYRFKKPCRLIIESPDGKQTLWGYGIGDTIEVLGPDIVTLQATRGLVEYLDLPDGSKLYRIPSEPLPEVTSVHA